jgi:hypothetical protein
LLLQRLRSVVTDEREIEFVVAAASGGSTQARIGRSVKYFDSASPPDVYAQLWFRRGRITSLETGRALQAESAQQALVDRASLETQHVHGSFVATRIQFASLQLKGQWTWRDQLRISPTPLSARVDAVDRTLSPSTQPLRSGGPPFPFLLEVLINKSPNGVLEARRTMWRLDKFQSLLALLLAPYVAFGGSSSERVWTLEHRDGAMVNALAQPGFSTGEEGMFSEFPERSDTAASFYDGPDYYNHLWFKDAEIFIPPTLAEDFDRVDSGQVQKCVYFASGMIA